MHINIRKVREQLGLSQAAMADELGIARSTYVNFESGRTQIFCKCLRRFVKYIGTSEQKLLFGEQSREGKFLGEGGHDDDIRKAIVQDYEDKLSVKDALIAESSLKLSESEARVSSQESIIKNLLATNAYLLSKLNKND